MGLEPGVSRKSDVDRVMGKPIKELVKGERYEYDPRGMDARQVAVRFNKQTQLVEGIDIVPQRSIPKTKYQKWLGLKVPDVTKKYSNGNLVEYYFDQGIVLLYSSPQDTSPIACFSHFNPLLAQQKSAVEKPVSRDTKTEVGKKTPASEENRRSEESIMGQWRWFNGCTVIINAGGSMVSLSDGKIVSSGKWKALVGARQYQLEWKEGGWVDKLTLSSDGKTLQGKNQHGGLVNGTRIVQ